jgi:hypothetical protein
MLQILNLVISAKMVVNVVMKIHSMQSGAIVIVSAKKRKILGFARSAAVALTHQDKRWWSIVIASVNA